VSVARILLVSQWSVAAGILLGTILSEDAAGLAAGSLVAQGSIGFGLAGGAVFAGIWLGDLLLFVIGRQLRPLATRWQRARRWLEDPRVADAARWLDQKAWKAMAITRVVPGTRLPTYLAAGLIGMSARKFMLWTAVAGAIWTPLLMGLGAGGAAALHYLMPGWSTHPWVLPLVTMTIIISLFTLVQAVARSDRRRAWAMRWRRWTHHEWWPTWTLYVPLLPIGVLLAIRHRSLRAPLMVNPAMPDSGIVGESKAAVLHRLVDAPVLPWCILPAASPAQRLARMHRWMDETGEQWPVILKPDAGERGSGVRLARHAQSAERWFSEHPRRAIAQRYHPGPCEVGIFWTRRPGRPGRILAITDKVFPVLIGDGQHSVAQLVHYHDRYRMQEPVFLNRLGQAAAQVPALDEVIPLALAGNHCQGCLFRDGAELITPELEAAVDRWMARSPGIWFGRFDVRAPSRQAIQHGVDLAVIELNGLTSEPTALYDPSRSPFFAWSLLIRSWNEAWAIGAHHRRHGARPPILADVMRRILHECSMNAAQDRTSD